MQDLISTIDYLPDSEDSWTFIWGNANYSSKKVYDMALTTLQVPRTFSILWKSQCTPRVKVFAWLMMVDRQNTRLMLRRRKFNIQSGVACVLCATGSEEDINHLFFSCPFAVRCWQKLQFIWDLTLDIHARILQARGASQITFFMEIFLIAAWEIGKLRNAVIFVGIRPTFYLWTVRFRDQVQLQLLRFNHDRDILVRAWLSSF